MFQKATSFNQNLCDWDMSAATKLDDFCEGHVNCGNCSPSPEPSQSPTLEPSTAPTTPEPSQSPTSEASPSPSIDYEVSEGEDFVSF